MKLQALFAPRYYDRKLGFSNEEVWRREGSRGRNTPLVPSRSHSLTGRRMLSHRRHNASDLAFNPDASASSKNKKRHTSSTSSSSCRWARAVLVLAALAALATAAYLLLLPRDGDGDGDGSGAGTGHASLARVAAWLARQQSALLGRGGAAAGGAADVGVRGEGRSVAELRASITSSVEAYAAFCHDGRAGICACAGAHSGRINSVSSVLCRPSSSSSSQQRPPLPPLPRSLGEGRLAYVSVYNHVPYNHGTGANDGFKDGGRGDGAGGSAGRAGRAGRAGGGSVGGGVGGGVAPEGLSQIERLCVLKASLEATGTIVPFRVLVRSPVKGSSSFFTRPLAHPSESSSADNGKGGTKGNDNGGNGGNGGNSGNSGNGGGGGEGEGDISMAELRALHGRGLELISVPSVGRRGRGQGGGQGGGQGRRPGGGPWGWQGRGNGRRNGR